jgi:hypothetical protein
MTKETCCVVGCGGLWVWMKWFIFRPVGFLTLNPVKEMTARHEVPPMTGFWCHTPTTEAIKDGSCIRPVSSRIASSQNSALCHHPYLSCTSVKLKWNLFHTYITRKNQLLPLYTSILTISPSPTFVTCVSCVLKKTTPQRRISQCPIIPKFSNLQHLSNTNKMVQTPLLPSSFLHPVLSVAAKV